MRKSMENSLKYYEPYGYTIPAHTGNQCVLEYGMLTVTNTLKNKKFTYKYILNK